MSADAFALLGRAALRGRRALTVLGRRALAVLGRQDSTAAADDVEAPIWLTPVGNAVERPSENAPLAELKPDEDGLVIGQVLRRSLFDSVRMLDGCEIPEPHAGSCSHAGSIRQFVRTDSRGGPGWMSDSYEGAVCGVCGVVLSERKIY